MLDVVSLEYESDTETLAMTVSTDFVKLKPALLVVDRAYVGTCGSGFEYKARSFVVVEPDL